MSGKEKRIVGTHADPTYHRRSPKRTCYLSPRFVELVRGYRQMASKKHGTISRSLEKR